MGKPSEVFIFVFILLLALLLSAEERDCVEVTEVGEVNFSVEHIIGMKRNGNNKNKVQRGTRAQIWVEAGMN